MDRPFCGDFDGDKLKDFVAYRNWTGEWFVLPTRLATFLITFQWGYPTDIPVGGDYDGDGRGKTEEKIVIDANETFFVDYS